MSGPVDNYVFQDGYAIGCNWNPCPDPDADSFYVLPTWKPASRDVSAPITDRIGVRVTFTHRWITSLFATSSDFTKDVDFQIEPQVFRSMIRPRLVRRDRSDSRSQGGVTLLETAIVIPMLLMLAIGLAEVGFLVIDHMAVANAAREGARVGAAAGPYVRRAE